MWVQQTVAMCKIPKFRISVEMQLSVAATSGKHSLSECALIGNGSIVQFMTWIDIPQ